MPAPPLGQVAAAQKIFSRNFQLQDLRTQRYLSTIRQPRDQVVLEMGGSDQFGGLVVGTRFSTGSIWHGDLYGLRAWTDVGASVTITLTLAHSADPLLVQYPLSTVPIVVAPYVEAVDNVSLQETDTGGGPNRPDISQYKLDPVVNFFEIIPGDILYCAITAAIGKPRIDPLTGLPAVDPLTGLPVAPAAGTTLLNVQLSLKLRPS